MAELRRGKPYCWVSWITGLLSGEDNCYWAAWFKCRYTYDKIEDDSFDMLSWRQAHQQMVEQRAEELRADGWTVAVEGQNAFRVNGKTATLSAKPDIVAIKGDDVLVVDAKSGKKKDEHLWQVFVYMRFVKQALGLTMGDNIRVSGEVFYPDSKIAIPPEEFTQTHIDRINGTLIQMGFAIPPAKAPSEKECQYCPIPRTECPERATDRMTLTTEDF